MVLLNSRKNQMRLNLGFSLWLFNILRSTGRFAKTYMVWKFAESSCLLKCVILLNSTLCRSTCERSVTARRWRGRSATSWCLYVDTRIWSGRLRERWVTFTQPHYPHPLPNTDLGKVWVFS